MTVAPNRRYRDLSFAIGHFLVFRVTGGSKHDLAIRALSLKQSYRPSRHYHHSYHNERSFHHVLLVRSVSFSDADGFYRESRHEPRMARSRRPPAEVAIERGIHIVWVTRPSSCPTQARIGLEWATWP